MHDHLFPCQSFFHGGRLQMHRANERPWLHVGHTQVFIFGTTLGREGCVCLRRRKDDAVSVLGNIHGHTRSSLPVNEYLDSMGQAKPLE